MPQWLTPIGLASALLLMIAGIARMFAGDVQAAGLWFGFGGALAGFWFGQREIQELLSLVHKLDSETKKSDAGG